MDAAPMLNTVGKCMEEIVARKFARDIGNTETLPVNRDNTHRKNAFAFAYDVYEGFQRKEQAVAVVIDLEVP